MRRLTPTLTVTAKVTATTTFVLSAVLGIVMWPSADPRKAVGPRVHAKGRNVTSDAECARRYSANKKTKIVHGVMVSTRSDSPGPCTKWYITADFSFGGADVKRKELSMRSVKSGDPPAPSATDTNNAGLSLVAPAREIIQEVEDHRRVQNPTYNITPASFSAPVAGMGSPSAKETVWCPEGTPSHPWEPRRSFRTAQHGSLARIEAISGVMFNTSRGVICWRLVSPLGPGAMYTGTHCWNNFSSSSPHSNSVLW